MRKVKMFLLMLLVFLMNWILTLKIQRFPRNGSNVDFQLAEYKQFNNEIERGKKITSTEGKPICNAYYHFCNPLLATGNLRIQSDCKIYKK